MKKILVFSYISAFVIALLLLVLSYTLPNAYPEPIKNICGSIGSTLMSIVLVTFFYEQWKYKDDTKKIEETAMTIASRYDPAVPCKIYPKSKEPGKDLKRDLIEALKVSNIYYYSGVGMTVAKESIKEICSDSQNWKKDSITMTFIVPRIDVEYLREDDRVHIQKYARSIVKYCKERAEVKFRIEFVFLPYMPSFHVHLTQHKCWFAFVDKGQSVFNDYKNTQKVFNRNRYPTTFSYKRDERADNDIIEMYATIKKITDDLRGRHEDAIYEFTFGGGDLPKEKWNGDKDDNLITDIFKYDENEKS